MSAYYLRMIVADRFEDASAYGRDWKAMTLENIEDRAVLKLDGSPVEYGEVLVNEARGKDFLFRAMFGEKDLGLIFAPEPPEGMAAMERQQPATECAVARRMADYLDDVMPDTVDNLAGWSSITGVRRGQKVQVNIQLDEDVMSVSTALSEEPTDEEFEAAGLALIDIIHEEANFFYADEYY